MSNLKKTRPVLPSQPGMTVWRAIPTAFRIRKISCKSLQKTITLPIPASMWMTVFPVEISKGPHFSR